MVHVEQAALGRLEQDRFAGLQSVVKQARGVGHVILGIRPETFDDAAFAKNGLPRVDVTVEVLEELGSDAYVFFRVAAPRVTVESRDAADEEAGLLAEDDSLFTARVDPATSGRIGAPLQLAVDPASFHFFDVQSGESLLADAGRQAAHEETLRNVSAIPCVVRTPPHRAPLTRPVTMRNRKAKPATLGAYRSEFNAVTPRSKLTAGW